MQGRRERETRVSTQLYAPFLCDEIVIVLI